MYYWVVHTLTQFFFRNVQLFGSLRLLGRPTPWQKIVSFALLQTSSFVLAVHILPIAELQFIFLSIAHLINFMWIFSTDLFPDALFCYLTPLAMSALGELIFPPLLLRFFPNLLFDGGSSSMFGPYYSYSAHLPSLFLAAYYLIRDAYGEKLGEKREGLFSYAGWLPIFVIVPTICYLKTPPLESLFPIPDTFLAFFFRANLIAVPILGLTIYKYINKDRKTERALLYHHKRRAVQEAALRTLREERHDLLNELALISSYIQMGRNEDALAAISYSAAKLSDRYNYTSLPDDAWTTVLELKQIEAKKRKIDFSVELETTPPESFNEQRLLPKIIMNLVDNAFAAVKNQANPKVQLAWFTSPQGERILTVANNGPEISPWDGQMIFRGGVTSKKDSSGNHGWGLAICQQIACELGASLTYESSPEQTIFIFALPPAAIAQEHLPAN